MALQPTDVLSEHDRELLKRGAAELGIDLDGEALRRFEVLYTRLHAVNAHTNLTRIAPADTVALHFLDSLTAASTLQIDPGLRVMDVGTGAGFPGLPLAIAFPATQFVLMDATRKKLDFVRSVVAELGLTSVTVRYGRAEELCSTELGSCFDIVVARAVAPMSRLAGWLLPYARKNAIAAAYKSGEALAEIEAARGNIAAHGGNLLRVDNVRVPGTEITRLVAVMKRTR